MSFQANRRQSQPDDGGYALPIVIVVIAVGAMVAIALLGYAAALLKAGADDADSLRHLYAADAGITAMRDHLAVGAEGNAAPEPLMVGGIKVEMTAYTPTPTPTPDRNPSPVTLPLTATPMPAKAISPRLPNPLEKEFSVVIESVPPRSVLDLRWEYSTTTDPTMSSEYTSPSIKVYPRPESEGTPIACPDYPQDNESLGCQQVSYEVQDTRVNLIIVFDPGTVEGLSTLQGHSPTCPNENGTTLCVARAPGGSNPPAVADKDEGPVSLGALQEEYVVISKAGDTTVTAYIRQIPGWCLDDSSDDLDVERTYERCDDVKILSWKPYPPDEDP